MQPWRSWSPDDSYCRCCLQDYRERTECLCEASWNCCGLRYSMQTCQNAGAVGYLARRGTIQLVWEPSQEWEGNAPKPRNAPGWAREMAALLSSATSTRTSPGHCPSSSHPMSLSMNQTPEAAAASLPHAHAWCREPLPPLPQQQQWKWWGAVPQQPGCSDRHRLLPAEAGPDSEAGPWPLPWAPG